MIRRPHRSDLGRGSDKSWSPRSTQVNCLVFDAVFGLEVVRRICAVFADWQSRRTQRVALTWCGVCSTPRERATDGTCASVWKRRRTMKRRKTAASRTLCASARVRASVLGVRVRGGGRRMRISTVDMYWILWNKNKLSQPRIFSTVENVWPALQCVSCSKCPFLTALKCC